MDEFYIGRFCIEDEYIESEDGRTFNTAKIEEMREFLWEYTNDYVYNPEVDEDLVMQIWFGGKLRVDIYKRHLSRYYGGVYMLRDDFDDEVNAYLEATLSNSACEWDGVE
jgi:hypothetical protein